MTGQGGLIFLDRDGVLNEMFVDPDHGTIDSPLNPSQVVVIPEASQGIELLAGLGFKFVVVTNQPSAAKGKTTRELLDAVHEKVLTDLGPARRHILESQICFHRSEDRCACRKPKPGMLEAAWKNHPGFEKSKSWMIGDGATDVQAGRSFGVKTAFLGPRKCDACKVFDKQGNGPDIWADNLLEVALAIKEKDL